MKVKHTSLRKKRMHSNRIMRNPGISNRSSEYWIQIEQEAEDPRNVFKEKRLNTSDIILGILKEL